MEFLTRQAIKRYNERLDKFVAGHPFDLNFWLNDLPEAIFSAIIIPALPVLAVIDIVRFAFDYFNACANDDAARRLANEAERRKKSALLDLDEQFKEFEANIDLTDCSLDERTALKNALSRKKLQRMKEVIDGL